MRITLPLLPSLLLLAFVLTRAVVPAGFMPSGNGALGFDWCPSQSADVITFLQGSDPNHLTHEHHHGIADDAVAATVYCDFAWLSAILVTPELAVALLILVLLSLLPLQRRLHISARYHRPLARAPPHI